MPASFYQALKLKINFANQKIKKGYYGSMLFYSCGNTVTYVVNGTNYDEDVEEGASVLSPASFTPGKPGWTFCGWSLSADNHSIQTNLVMGENPMTLYAVWSKETYVPAENLPWTYNGAAEALTPYNPGGNWNATVSIDNVTDMFNATVGETYCTITVGGTAGRVFKSSPIYGPDYSPANPDVTGYSISEEPGHPGFGGASFQISGSGSITAACSKWDPPYKHYTGGDIHIGNVVRAAHSSTEYSVG